MRKSEAFATVTDNLKLVEVRIFQGENQNALENIQIGEFRIEDLADAPAGNIIILDLALDRDGILHVSAKEKAIGLERRITIDKAMSRYDKEEIEEARQHIDQLFGEATSETAQATDAEGSAARDPKIMALLAKGAREARQCDRGGPRRDRRSDRGHRGQPGERRRGRARRRRVAAR